MNDNKAIPENLVAVNIINLLEMLYEKFILPTLHINYLRFQNSYESFCKHSLQVWR